MTWIVARVRVRDVVTARIVGKQLESSEKVWSNFNIKGSVCE